MRKLRYAVSPLTVSSLFPLHLLINLQKISILIDNVLCLHNIIFLLKEPVTVLGVLRIQLKIDNARNELCSKFVPLVSYHL